MGVDRVSITEHYLTLRLWISYIIRHDLRLLLSRSSKLNSVLYFDLLRLEYIIISVQGFHCTNIREHILEHIIMFEASRGYTELYMTTVLPVHWSNCKM